MGDSATLPSSSRYCDRLGRDAIAFPNFKIVLKFQGKNNENPEFQASCFSDRN
ncbi:MAG: hypothetical protein AB4290_23585 [Spirulina sp.]